SDALPTHHEWSQGRSSLPRATAVRRVGTPPIRGVALATSLRSVRRNPSLGGRPALSERSGEAPGAVATCHPFRGSFAAQANATRIPRYGDPTVVRAPPSLQPCLPDQP